MAATRDDVWIRHGGETVASYARSYEQGQWFPPPRMRPDRQQRHRRGNWSSP